MSMTDETFDYSATALPDFLSMDLWGEVEACKLLANLDPRNFGSGPTGSRFAVKALDGRPATDAQVDNFERILNVWRSCDHSAWLQSEQNAFVLDRQGRRKFAVGYFIDWAIERGIPIPWLDWALDSGRLKELSALVVRSKDLRVIDPKAKNASTLFIDLYDAREKFWGKASGEDEPTNDEVIIFLKKERGWVSKNLLAAAPAIIRPDTSTKGRSTRRKKKQ